MEFYYMSGLEAYQGISDSLWNKIEANLPGGAGKIGRLAGDNRKFVDAVIWILQTGAPWRDLPPSYGDWKNTHRRFIRWRESGIWEYLLTVMLSEPGFEWLVVDMAYLKNYRLKAGNKANSEGGGLPKYACPWMRLVCQSEPLLKIIPQLLLSRMVI